jgi:hypothetical protein
LAAAIRFIITDYSLAIRSNILSAIPGATFSRPPTNVYRVIASRASPSTHPWTEGVINMGEGHTGMHGMGMEHEMMKPDMLWMMWEKLDDKTKKSLAMRKIDQKIMDKEAMIKHMQFKIEILRMMKQWMEKM